MKKHKSPSELSSKTIRITIGDYALLDAISTRHDCTFAEALHMVITDQAKRDQVVTPRAQMPMPLTTAYQVMPTTAYRSRSTIAIATNGSKGVAFRIQPKGARYA